MYAQLHAIERTHWWFRGRRRVLGAALRRSGVRARTILDVGCGTGGNLDLLQELEPGATVIGIDILREPLEFCRRERSLPLLRADVARLPFAAGAFDLVAAFDTLEHVADDVAVLREIHRVCRPAGVLVLTVPAFPFLWGNIDEVGHHYRRYRKAELLARLEAAGFAVRLARFFNFLLFPPIAALRVLARLRPATPAHDGAPVRSDFDLVKSGPLNEILTAIFSLEASLLELRPPFGVSLLCVAERRAI